MLSFYHIKVLAARRANQQRRQGPQCREVDTGDVSHLPRAVGRRFEHPARDLLYREHWLPEDCAADHGRAVSGAHGPDAHLASVPGVPRVADFQHVGIVGAPSLGCTTGFGRTVRWGIGLPPPSPVLGSRLRLDLDWSYSWQAHETDIRGGPINGGRSSFVAQNGVEAPR